MKVRFGEFFDGFTSVEASAFIRGTWQLRMVSWMTEVEDFGEFWQAHENDIVDVEVYPCIVNYPDNGSHLYHILSWEIEDKKFEYQTPMNAEEIVGALDAMELRD